MIIDSKGKLFGKVSIIDILIVLVIIAGVGGVTYKFNKSKAVTPFTKTEDIQIVFFTEDIPDYVAQSIKQGDLVKDRVSNSVFGRVKEVKIDKGIFYAPNDRGEMVASSKPGYVSLMLTVEGQGIYTDNGVTFGNVDYYINKTLEVRAGNTAIWTRVYNIRK